VGVNNTRDIEEDQDLVKVCTMQYFAVYRVPTVILLSDVWYFFSDGDLNNLLLRCS